jgi:hypothetical protein
MEFVGVALELGGGDISDLDGETDQDRLRWHIALAQWQAELRVVREAEGPGTPAGGDATSTISTLPGAVQAAGHAAAEACLLPASHTAPSGRAPPASQCGSLPRRCALEVSVFVGGKDLPHVQRVGEAPAYDAELRGGGCL